MYRKFVYFNKSRILLLQIDQVPGYSRTTAHIKIFLVKTCEQCITLNGKRLNINIIYAPVQLYRLEGCQRKRIGELSIDCSR